MRREGRGRRPTTRRRLLRAGATSGLAGVAGLAGCLDGGGGTEPGADRDDPGESPTPGPTDTTIAGVSGSFRQFQYDAANSGYRSAGGVDEDATTRWTVREAPLGPGHHVSTPAVADGVVYFAEGGEFDGESISARVHAVDAATGAVDWSRDLGGTNAFRGTAVAGDTVLQPVGGAVVALDAATGDERWRTSADLDTGVTVADGAAYVAGRGYDGPTTLYALDLATGEARWTHDLPGGRGAGIGASQPAVVDGTVYVAHGALAALAAADGTELWTASYDSGVAGAPTVVDGTAYLGGGRGTVRAVSAADGTTRWVRRVPSGAAGGGGRTPLSTSVAVGGGRVFAVRDWRLTVLAADTGERRWSRDVRGAHSPVVAGETVYVPGLSTLGGLDVATGAHRFGVSTAARSGSRRSVAVVDGAAFFPSAGLHAVA
ncbi:MAG: PQQ-binding-like beta-propeller repeat protein [Haloarculaceae archaeon]